MEIFSRSGTRFLAHIKKVDNSRLVYGCDTYMGEAEAGKIGMMLKIPFIPYRKKIEYPEVENLE